MVEYDLTKDDTVKENILQKKSIREGVTVLLTVALLMGSGEKIHALSMMEHGEYRTAKAWTVPTATTYDLHMYAWNKMNVDIARYSCSIPVEGMKNFKEKMGTAAKEVAMPMQSNVSERPSDVTAVIVPDTPKGDVTYDRTEGTITEETGENAGTVTSINGFLCDVDGRIVGYDGITVTDGVLNIPADSRCTAIAGGVFIGLGSEVFEVYIPANIVDISDSAFDGLSELFYIEVHPDNPVYGSSNGELYRKP